MRCYTTSAVMCDVRRVPDVVPDPACIHPFLGEAADGKAGARVRWGWSTYLRWTVHHTQGRHQLRPTHAAESG
jgi:hypothetical protein